MAGGFIFVFGVALLGAATARQSFDVPGGSAEQALKEFSRQSGLEILFVSENVASVRTNAVKGTYTPREAIDVMLAETRLTVAQDNRSGALRIQRMNDPKAERAAQPGPASRSDRPAPGRSNEEQTITLSPFEVNTSRDVGYLASNSLAGTRTNESLKDTAAAISVLTAEFISDIGALDLTEAVAYAVNVELQLDDDRTFAPNGNETVQGYQSYRVRGLAASVGRNYFAWNLPSDVFNLERIEESRGPNSVLFGISSPGGLINTSTKQAQGGRAFWKGGFAAGSFGSWRGSLDVNQPVLQGKLAFRINAVTDRNNNFRHWSFGENRRGHLAAKYLVSDKTRVRAEIEGGKVITNVSRSYNLLDSLSNWEASGRPTFATQAANVNLGVNRLSSASPRVTFIGNEQQPLDLRGMMSTTGNTGGAVITDKRMTDYSINPAGPAGLRFSDYKAISAYVEHQFSPNTFLEVAFNHQDHDFEGFDERDSHTLRGDPNRLLNTGAANPYVGRLYLESSWFRIVRQDAWDTARATFSTGFDARKWGKYKIGAFKEYEKNTRFSYSNNENWFDPATGAPAFNAVPDSAANNVWRRTYVTERDWPTYFVNGAARNGLLKSVRDPVTGRTLSSTWDYPRTVSETRITQKAYMLAGQARYFDGRLILAGGFRYDDYFAYVRGRRRDPVTRYLSLAPTDADADPTTRATRNDSVGRNRTFGVMYHVTPKLSVFYNQANNISLPARGQTVFKPSGEPGDLIPVPTPKGEGNDYGLALELLEGRLYARAAYYTTAGKDQSTTGLSSTNVGKADERILAALLGAGLIGQAEFDKRSEVASFGLFDQTSEGYELQITANATKNWRFQTNFAYTQAVENNKLLEWKAWAAQSEKWVSQLNTTGIVTITGSTIAEEIAVLKDGIREFSETDGLQKLGNRPYKVSGFTRYGFSSGWLKGAFVGGGYRYQCENFVGLSNAGRKLYGKSYWYSDAMAGYTLSRLPRGRKLSLQLNVSNIFNQRDPLVTRYSEIGTQMFVFREVLQPPITWRLTSNMEF